MAKDTNTQEEFPLIKQAAYLPEFYTNIDGIEQYAGIGTKLRKGLRVLDRIIWIDRFHQKLCGTKYLLDWVLWKVPILFLLRFVSKKQR